MKLDRRWWNDGRLERECRAWSDRDRAPDDVHEYFRGLYGFDVDVRVTAGGHYHVTAVTGARLRVTLPEEKTP